MKQIYFLASLLLVDVRGEGVLGVDGVQGDGSLFLQNLNTNSTLIHFGTGLLTFVLCIGLVVFFNTYLSIKRLPFFVIFKYIFSDCKYQTFINPYLESPSEVGLLEVLLDQPDHVSGLYLDRHAV